MYILLLITIVVIIFYLIPSVGASGRSYFLFEHNNNGRLHFTLGVFGFSSYGARIMSFESREIEPVSAILRGAIFIVVGGVLYYLGISIG